LRVGEAELVLPARLPAVDVDREQAVDVALLARVVLAGANEERAGGRVDDGAGPHAGTGRPTHDRAVRPGADDLRRRQGVVPPGDRAGRGVQRDHLTAVGAALVGGVVRMLPGEAAL